MRKILKTEAIVLKKKYLLNKDAVITCFSQKEGKITLFAKGVRTINSKRLPHIQTGNLIDLIANESHNAWYLQETKLISHFSLLKKDRQKVALCYAIFFILDRMLPELVPEPRIYQVLVRFLSEITKSSSISTSKTASFLNTVLQLLGYSQKELSYGEVIAAIEEIIGEKVPFLVI